MTDWSSGTIASNGITLHYTRTGGDKPPLVLAHGFSDDGLCWTPVAKQLETEYDVIMVDARGHGRSDAPDGGYHAQTMATDLAGVITGLGLNKPVVMGHSMGGSTTMALAGFFPDLPGAIIIEDAGAGNIMADKSPEALARLQGWHDRMEMLQRKTHAELIEHAHTVTPTWAEPELEPWAHAKLRFNMKALDRSDAVPLDWAELLGNIKCPALLLYADPERGGGVTAERAAEMQAMLPQLQTVHIAGAGHNIRREQFEAYMDAVQSFLAKTVKQA
ncbi:MAG TPA: alpha/beta hydrolase [Caldilineaceae bacterium]|nr:alpha/beta hydrolase [Caldilineaceae bacterium]